jgi:hypothetical protein
VGWDPFWWAGTRSGGLGPVLVGWDLKYQVSGHRLLSQPWQLHGGEGWRVGIPDRTGRMVVEPRGIAKLGHLLGTAYI